MLQRTTRARARTVLSLAALMTLGLVAADLAPAFAKPPPWAPAHGYRRKHGDVDYSRRHPDHRHDHDHDDDFDYERNRRYRHDDDFRYSRRERTRRSTRDIDGDGIRNGRDRDMDGDGRINSRDRYPRDPRRS